MRLRRSLGIVLISLTACSQAEVSAPRSPAPAAIKAPAAMAALCATDTNPPPDSGMPKGFDYPQDVAKWVTDRSGHRMRLHAWCLFAGLNLTQGPNGPLLWQSWNTSTQAFPNQYNWPPTGGASRAPRPSALNARNQANAPVDGPGAINYPAPTYPVPSAVSQQYPKCMLPSGQLRDGQRLQNNGDIMIAGVIYNDAAFKNIVGSQQLYNSARLDSLLPPQGSPATTIPPFPSASIVLKPMFWPVQQGGFTALPVWDWDANKPGSSTDGQYAGYEMQKFWSRAVAITDLANPTPPATVTYLYQGVQYQGKTLGPITYGQSALQAVNVQRFYRRQLGAAELAALSDCDRALLDQSAWWAYNRGFKAGDWIVLVALHVMTKEQWNWTFQTFWWHPDAANPSACGRYCKDRPTNVPDPTINNYLVATTYGQTEQAGNTNYYAPPGSQRPLWPVAYNPYIELAASHPITTNCMNCHHRAAWPSELSRPGERTPASTYLQQSPAHPNALEKYVTIDLNAPSEPVLNSLLLLDAMWAISDRAGPPK